MPHYDVLIIGSGVGYKLATKTARLGLRTALVDRDPPGGTCPNRGCIPSKIWITVADKVREAEQLTTLGVEMTMDSVDFCKELLDPEVAVVATPGAWISDPAPDGSNPGEGFVRFALVPSVEDTLKAAERISAARW